MSGDRAIRSNDRSCRSGSFQAGVTMIELLVSLVILTIGLLGIAQLYAAGQRSELEGQQRAQALLLVNDMADRINANRSAAQCYPFTQGSDGAAYVGTGNGTTYTCSGVDTSATRAIADEDLADWGDKLAGNDVTGGASLVGARGCIYDDGTDDTYRIVVTWQGRSLSDDSGAPNCATGEYGGITDGQSRRRWISRTIEMADLG